MILKLIKNEVLKDFPNSFKTSEVNLDDIYQNLITKIKIDYYKKEVDLDLKKSLEVFNIKKPLAVCICSLKDITYSQDPLTSIIENVLSNLILMKYFDYVNIDYKMIFPGENSLDLSLNKIINDYLNQPIKVDEKTFFMYPINTLSAILVNKDANCLHKCFECSNLKCLYRVDYGCSGNCKHCKVKTKDYIIPNKFDLLYLTEEEISSGFRILCKHDFDYQIHSEFNSTYNVSHLKEDGLGLAIDLGTTIICFSLVRLDTFEIIKTVSKLNPLRVFGKDVLSRVSNYQPDMHKILTDFLNEVIEVEFNANLKKSVICGNTIMMHFLIGYDVRKVVYENQNILKNDLIITDNSIIKNCFETIIPRCISTFVGSDCLCGLMTIDEVNPYLFLDLGTNGEVAYFTQEKIYIATSACGPTFEGGNISCGVNPIKGAIYKIDHQIHTISNSYPIGLCGSGLVDAIGNNLYLNIEKNGNIKEDIKITENIYLNQKDIRNVQLSKAAIKATIEMLLKGNLVKTMYLCGGFGSNLNATNAIKIGMIPDVIDLVFLGNTSLKGALQVLRNKNTLENMTRIVDKIEVIDQSLFPDFNSLFINCLDFE